MKFLKVMGWIVGLPVGGFVLLVLFMMLRDCSGFTPPEVSARASARAAIEKCWSNQSSKSNVGAMASNIAGICQKMEADFVKVNGFQP